MKRPVYSLVYLVVLSFSFLAVKVLALDDIFDDELDYIIIEPEVKSEESGKITLQSNIPEFIPLNQADESYKFSVSSNNLPHICDPDSLKFSGCIASKCIINTQFADITCEIRKMEEGKCLYTETTPNISKMTCEIPTESLHAFKKHFETHLVHGVDRSMWHFCRAEKDIQKDEVKIKPKTALTEAVKKKPGPTKSISLPGLFFTKAERIMMENIFTENPAGKIQAEQLVIRLNSILFLNNKHWAIWINDSKLTSTDEENKLNILVDEVTPKKVKLRWITDNLSIYSPDWKKKSKYISYNTSKIRNYNIYVRLLEDMFYEVSFSLAPKQRLDLHNMAIIG